MTITAPVAMLPYSVEPRMDRSGCVYYRHYRITTHALERYIERIGGDVGNLIIDLDNSGVLEVSNKRISGEIRSSLTRCESEGGWALTNNQAIFIVMPALNRHVIVTTLLMNTEQRDA